MTRKAEITIYDLAKKLNYSPSTISRALNNHKSIGKKAKQLINETAKEMGYTPNLLAAGLRNKKSKTIGVLVPTIEQPFLSSLISGVEITAKKAGYNVVIMQSHDSYNEEINIVNSMYNTRVSGVICSLAMETKDTSHFDIFINNNIPLVFVDRVSTTINAFRVVIDNYHAGYIATEHLIEQGCKRIAHITAGSNFSIFNERKRGYLDALQDHNIAVDPTLIYKIDEINYKKGEQASKKLLNLKQPPDGIFTAMDIFAVATIQCAKKMGIQIPEKLAVIGFNDDPISKIIDPPLSTISHPAKKMGEISAKQILKYAKKNSTNTHTEVSILNTKVIIRKSSKRKKL